MSLQVCHYTSPKKIVCHFTSLHEYVTICSTLCALPFWPHKLFCGVWQFRLEKIGEAYSLAHFVVFCFAVGLPEMNVFLSHVLSLRISLCRIQSLPLIGSCPAKGVKRQLPKKKIFLYFCTKRSSQGYCNWMNTLDSPICKHGPSITDFFTSMTGQTNFFVDSFMIQRRGYI